ncbi:MAG: S9 family peptidase [Alphaproteobacteria bacterium]|nr:S9 family peptidase [Alphaproteobacteria bacterium]
MWGRALGVALATGLGVWLAGLAPVAAQERAALTPEAMWDFARIGAPALAPDGRSAVVAVTRFPADAESPAVDLFLVPTDGGVARRLTSDPASESNPEFSPDGAALAFIARRDEDDAAQIYLLPMAGGEAQRLTDIPTGVSQPRWAPDGGSVFFLAPVWPDLEGWAAQGERARERANGRMTARVWDRAPFTYWDQFVDDREYRLFQADVDTGVVAEVETGRPVYAVSPGPRSYAVSPDGGEIAFMADVDPTGVRPNLDVFTLNLSTGETRNLTEANIADDSEPLYSPDGRYLLWGQQRIFGFYGDKVRPMLLDRRHGGVQELASAFDRSASGLIWAPDSRSLFGSVDDASVRRAYRYPVNGGPPQRLTTGEDIDSLAVSAAGVMVGVRQSFSAPPHLVRINPRSGEAAALYDWNTEALAGIEMGRVESVTYPGANGAEIQMWVVYPPGFDASRKYPLMLLLHGGPHNGITNSWTYRWNAQVFAGWGYVTAWHNFHGSSGFGQAFTDSINPNRSDLPYHDTIAAAEWFTAQPWIDAERMMAGGGSYGGYLASVLMGRDHPFRALVAHAAVYNNYTQVAADYGPEEDRFFQYWEDPARWQAYSPHMAAENFVTPTLIIHGQLDYRVPVNHGFELFSTLQTRGVPSRMIYYPNENHWILKRDNSIFWYSAYRAWAEQWAPPGPDAAATPLWTPSPDEVARSASGRSAPLPH